MFPLQAIHRHRVFRHQAVEVGVLGEQRRQHVVGVRRLAQVVAGATFDRFHRGGDARVSGEDHHAHLGVQLEQLGQQHQAGVTIHLQVEHRVVGDVALGQQQALLGGIGHRHAQATPTHGARQHAGEGLVVVHQQQMRLFFRIEQGFFAHFIPRKAGSAFRRRRNCAAVATRSACRLLRGYTASLYHRRGSRWPD
ncbi:hypothetical protein D3C80_1585610 [compost metagenome]